MAAQPLVGVAKIDPVSTLEANIRGTWNVLEAARQAKVKQVMVASSDKAYGASDHLPYREEDALQAEQPYDVSKSCTDLISRMYAKAFGLNIGIARCANLFGGGDFNLSRFLPGLIRSTYLGENFVIRSDGKFVRDYLYVRDGVSAYLRMAEVLAANPALSGEAFNFSMEIKLTVLELTEAVLSLMDASELRPVILNQAQGEIREQYLNCDKARRVLDWRPSYTLQEGL
ncbi:MAG TPA: sugar dehydratase, partial [Solibacterales bacterium]|nr:sugar dehydratase [Bryobacterales bacterium]